MNLFGILLLVGAVLLIVFVNIELLHQFFQNPVAERFKVIFQSTVEKRDELYGKYVYLKTKEIDCRVQSPSKLGTRNFRPDYVLEVNQKDFDRAQHLLQHQEWYEI